MKALVKTTSLFSLLVISALFCVAQQTPLPSQQPLALPVSNSVRLVIEGKVINVHDGDTVTLIDQTNKKTNIRLQGIDAPELKQAFGAAAQENLSRIVLGKHVTVYWTKVDKYRRTVGTIMLDGRDVNIEQVKAGVAWHFKKYEDEQPAEDRRTYAAAQQEARAARLGLWGDPKSIAPGDWRQAVKIKRWGPPPPEGTIIGNLKSKKYHRPDCPGYRDMAEANRAFFTTVAEAETAGYKRAGNCPAEIQPVAVKAAAVAQTNGTASASERETRTSVVPASHQQGEIIRPGPASAPASRWSRPVDRLLAGEEPFVSEQIGAGLEHTGSSSGRASRRSAPRGARAARSRCGSRAARNCAATSSWSRSGGGRAPPSSGSRPSGSRRAATSRSTTGCGSAARTGSTRSATSTGARCSPTWASTRRGSAPT